MRAFKIDVVQRMGRTRYTAAPFFGIGSNPAELLPVHILFLHRVILQKL